MREEGVGLKGAAAVVGSARAVVGGGGAAAGSFFFEGDLDTAIRGRDARVSAIRGQPIQLAGPPASLGGIPTEHGRSL